MNKIGETAVLNTIIGAVIGLGVAAITISTIFWLVNVGNPEADSLKALANKVNEVNKEDPGSKGVVIYFQDEGSFFYPINEKTRNNHIKNESSNFFANERDFLLTHTKRVPDCENNNCICLCQEFDQEVTKRCKTGKLFCENLAGVSFSPGSTRLFTRLKEGGISSFELGAIALSSQIPGVGGFVAPALTSYVLEDKDPFPASQRVQVIKCRGGEEYCKNSKEGDISIIFDELDKRGAYDSIK
jgi:hypothetical protein